MVGALAKASGTELNEAGPAERRPEPDAFQIPHGHTEFLQKKKQGLAQEFGSPSSGELLETAADAPDF